MAAVCETLQVHDESDDSEAGALDDLLGLGGALADASDDDNDALVDDAFARRARGAGEPPDLQRRTGWGEGTSGAEAWRGAGRGECRGGAWWAPAERPT